VSLSPVVFNIVYRTQINCIWSLSTAGRRWSFCFYDPLTRHARRTSTRPAATRRARTRILTHFLSVIIRFSIQFTQQISRSSYYCYNLLALFEGLLIYSLQSVFGFRLGPCPYPDILHPTINVNVVLYYRSSQACHVVIA